MWIDKIGGRKFVMTLVVLGVFLVLELTGHNLDLEQVLTLVGLVGAYNAANALSKRGGDSDGR